MRWRGATTLEASGSSARLIFDDSRAVIGSFLCHREPATIHIKLKTQLSKRPQVPSIDHDHCAALTPVADLDL